MKQLIVRDRRDNDTQGNLKNSVSCDQLLVVHSNAVMAAGMKTALADRSWQVEACSPSSPADIALAADRCRPACILIDAHLHYGDGGGIRLIPQLVSTGAYVVMLTAERRRVVLAECLDSGAAGWISLDADLDEVDSTLRSVVAGRPIISRVQRAELLDLLRRERSAACAAHAMFERLTPREVLVLVSLADGLTADEIARENFVSVATVRSQIRAVLQKLGVRSQLAAVAIADEHRDLLPSAATPEHGRRRSDPKHRHGVTAPTGQTA